MYDKKEHVEVTFNENNLSPYLLQAQWAEFVELKKALYEIHGKVSKGLKILDIGIGDARIPRHLSGINEIWNTISSYEGIDIAQNCVDLSKQVAESLSIQNKVSSLLLDATHLENLQKKYHVILSTWFTVGNFYPSTFSFEDFQPGFDMSSNDKFSKVFRQAYEMLEEGGEIIIGSMYIDNENTRLKQEVAYRSFGWTVITDERDCFTASKEGWWSQRFTKERVYAYLNFIPKENISFTPLDTYNYAMMVRIKK